MTPKEKVKELVDRFREFADGTDIKTDRYSPNIEKQNAKQCALIAVDEILKEIDDNYDTLHSADRKKYWQEVKKELENL